MRAEGASPAWRHPRTGPDDRSDDAAVAFTMVAAARAGAAREFRDLTPAGEVDCAV